jgi:arylsulfatase A-like enzyme
MPTVLEATGAGGVAAGVELDGASLVPVFGGKPAAERAVFWHYPHYGNQGGAPASAIRRGDWKLIEWLEDGSLELFDVARDIGETRELSRTHPERTATLHAELKAWRAQLGARLPQRNPNYDPAAPDGRAAVRSKQP